jgi:hypothetical protein
MFMNYAWQIIGNNVWWCSVTVGMRNFMWIICRLVSRGTRDDPLCTVFTPQRACSYSVWHYDNSEANRATVAPDSCMQVISSPVYLLSYLNLSKCIPSLPGPWGLTWCHSVSRNVCLCLFVLKEIVDCRFSACVPRNQNLRSYKLELR